MILITIIIIIIINVIKRVQLTRREKMATPKRARIEEREVRVKKPRLLLFEESSVIPQGISNAAASQLSCF